MLVKKTSIHSLKNLPLILFAFILLFGFLQYELWIGQGGIFSFIHLNYEIKAQQKIVNDFETENTHLLFEIKDLRYGHEIIEEKARTKLGMIKPDETYYQFLTP
jgi:cell division protein FtsB